MTVGSIRTYNHEIFPPGTRVKVHAAQPMEGTDHDWHGMTGTVIKNGMWVLVKMDRKHRNWGSQEVHLCNHNLRKLT